MPKPTSAARRALCLAAPLLVTPLAACGDDATTAPLPGEPVAVTFLSLTVDDAEALEGGLLRVEGAVRPWLQAGQVAAVRLSTSAGDAEVVPVGPAHCPDASRGAIACDELLVMMREGVDVATVRAHATALGGWMRRVRGTTGDGHVTYASMDWGVLTLPLGADLDAALRAARGWPGVRLVEPNGIVSAAAGGLAGGTRDVGRAHAHVGVVAGTPAPGDGRLQWTPGATLTVEHAQPDGTTIRRTAPMR